MYICPLCKGTDNQFYHEDKRRQYLQCQSCQLVFVDPSQRLTPEQEKAIYDQHENDPGDQGYRRFLSRIAEPMDERLGSNQQGLDFGCGPGPALAQMMRERGIT